MKIAVLQIRSVLEPASNLAKIRLMLAEANKAGAVAAFLPEVFYSLGDGTQASPYLVDGKNEHYLAIQNLAKESGLYILGGSAATLVAGKVKNRAYNISPDGSELGLYDKINLFAVDLSKHSSHTVLDEAKIYSSGKEPLLVKLGQFTIGMAICFDLRFPELFRSYSHQGANVLSISSAFTVPTGKAHWHTLLRARAIENQCYVIASAQWGQHNEKISTFGHSLIIDPWGEILQDAGEGEKIIYADLEMERVENVRSRLNVLRDPRV